MTRYHAPNVISRATVTLLPYRKPMPMPPLSLWWLCKATNVLLLELSEIADLTVKEQLQTISDVSSVSIWGEKRYSMRLWLDPIKMSGYGITPIDVKNAVDKENVELPSGSIEGNTTELTIRTLGLMHTAEEFNNLIVKEENDRIIRFSDIGRAETGPCRHQKLHEDEWCTHGGNRCNPPAGCQPYKDSRCGI